MFFGKTGFQYEINLLDDTFPMGYHMPTTKIICKSYDLGKLMY
jgi:hypothetical protein